MHMEKNTHGGGGVQEHASLCIFTSSYVYRIIIMNTHTHIYSTYMHTVLGMDSFCHRSTFPNRLWLNSSLERFNFMEEQTAREGATEREKVWGEKRETDEWVVAVEGGGADRNRKRLKQAADREQRLKGRMEDERERVRHSKEGDYLSQGGRQW